MMPEEKGKPKLSDILRRKAEKLLRQGAEITAAAPMELLSLIHELDVHQTELEIQNEELGRAQQEITRLQMEYADSGYSDF